MRISVWELLEMFVCSLSLLLSPSILFFFSLPRSHWIWVNVCISVCVLYKNAKSIEDSVKCGSCFSSSRANVSHSYNHIESRLAHTQNIVSLYLHAPIWKHFTRIGFMRVSSECVILVQILVVSYVQFNQIATDPILLLLFWRENTS